MDHAVILLNLLRQALARDSGADRVGVLFSGGLDSSVIASLCLEHGRASLYTIGTAGSHDLEAAKRTASMMGWEWQGIVLKDDDVIEALLPLSAIIATDAPLPLSYEMPLYLVAQRALEHDLFSGQGADELFGGYARYLRMDDGQRQVGMRGDVKALAEVGSKMEHTLAGHFGKAIHHPYLDPAVVDFGLALPPSQCIHGEERKVVLREAARLLHLGETAGRPKKAAQYGSGIMKAMKAEAKRRKVDLKGLVATLQAEEERS
jgi:asparagine synthase (glutamine-hydrolysing)